MPRFSQLLAKGQLRQYLLRTGPIRLGDILAQSPDQTETLIALLRLKKEGEVRLDGEKRGGALFESLADKVAGFIEESRPAFTVQELQDSTQNPVLAHLIVSLSENGFRKAATGV